MSNADSKFSKGDRVKVSSENDYGKITDMKWESGWRYKIDFEFYKTKSGWFDQDKLQSA